MCDVKLFCGDPRKREVKIGKVKKLKMFEHKKMLTKKEVVNARCICNYG